MTTPPTLDPPPNPVLPQVLYTVNEAAQILRISRAMLYRLVRRGDLALRHIGARSYLTRDDLDTFIAALPTTSGDTGSGEAA